MSENTTNTSNDESRKETKTVYISDEEVKKRIEEWTGEDKWIYVATMDPEFTLQPIDMINASTSSNATSDARHIKVTKATRKHFEDLINEEKLVTVIPKTGSGKYKKAREAKKRERERENTRTKTDNKTNQEIVE